MSLADERNEQTFLYFLRVHVPFFCGCKNGICNVSWLVWQSLFFARTTTAAATIIIWKGDEME